MPISQKKSWVLPFLMLCLLASKASATLQPAVLHIDTPALLAQWQQELSLGSHFGQPDARDNQTLYRAPNYKKLADHITAALKQRLKNDPLLSVTMAKSHRLFDWRWLRSATARFELVAIVNRLDKNQGSSCGETRLIYRLAYSQRDGQRRVGSRLPMTVNVVYRQSSEADNCRAAALRWQRNPEHLALLNGPLHAAQLRQELLKSIEVNLQAQRWPSTIRPDMGGYAEYLLRVFEPVGRELELALLENTPAVERLKANPNELAQLKEWLLTHTNEIESGTLQIPEKFLAKEVSSHALHGIERRANRPFRQLFKPSDLGDNGTELLERLDSMTCSGCHQTRSVAGFHLLGKDNAETHPMNAIAVSQSPHFAADQQRRFIVFQQALAGRSLSGSQPFARQASSKSGTKGAHCRLNRANSCAEGLQCLPWDTAKDSQWGRCLRRQPAQAGDACQVGRITQRANPLRDRVIAQQKLSCEEGVCQTTRVGFPGGMCSSSCRDLKAGETCGAIAELSGFNRCLGQRLPLAECLENHHFPASLQACDLQTPCRDDYVCQRTENGEGGCIPPYFLFQLRVDGHPKP